MSGPADREDMEFSTFVISLASNAAMQLDAGHPAFDLALARQTIDILAMLEVKTAGNLSAGELDLLRGLLYQTRLAFAEAMKSVT
jgi:hypothetical protein